MNFCTYDEYNEFMRSCTQFETMIQRSWIILIKNWLSVSDTEQEKGIQDRNSDPTKRWKISPMDMKAREKSVDYSRAKDDMFASTDIPESPWNVVEADDKKRARLNCISHLLKTVPYEKLPPKEIELPPRQKEIDYERPPLSTQNFVPAKYWIDPISNLDWNNL